MIFIIGLICWAVSWVLFRTLGTGMLHVHNKADCIGGLLAWVGMVLMGISTIIMIASVLP